MAKPAGGPFAARTRSRSAPGWSQEIPAEGLKFESLAKFFNPFNRVNFRSARRRSRPSRNKEGFRTTRLARGIQAAKDPRIGQLYAETREPVWFALPN